MTNMTRSEALLLLAKTLLHHVDEVTDHYLALGEQTNRLLLEMGGNPVSMAAIKARNAKLQSDANELIALLER